MFRGSFTKKSQVQKPKLKINPKTKTPKLNTWNDKKNHMIYIREAEYWFNQYKTSLQDFELGSWSLF